MGRRDAAVARDAVRPLVSAGDQVLVGIAGRCRRTRPTPRVLFNLDLDRTNLIRAPDWPILDLEPGRDAPAEPAGPERWNYRVGEWVRVRLARDPTAPLRFRCGAIERAAAARRASSSSSRPRRAGCCRSSKGDRVLFELGVNFLDEAETDLRRQATAETGQLAAAAGLRAESGPASDPLFWMLLAIGGTAMLANWCLSLAGRRARA